jgi:hypothetical protein
MLTVCVAAGPGIGNYGCNQAAIKPINDMMQTSRMPASSL